MSERIAIVAPNYYPQTCGVGDHSMRVASELGRRGLAAAVFTRAPAEANPEAPEVVAFGYASTSPAMLARDIYAGVRSWRASRLIVQYTPQMLDASRFGSAAVPGLVRRARRDGLGVTVLAHEVFTPWSWRPDLALGALGHRLMLCALLRSASSVLVTTDSRSRRVSRLARLVGALDQVSVVRVGPNALPVDHVVTSRGVHLGAFSTMTVGKRFDVLLEAFALIGDAEPEARLSLIGDLGRVEHRAYHGLMRSIREHPFAARISLTGKLPLHDVARLVASLDVYFHPDDMGASTRSGTLPLAFGSGVPVVSFSGVETDSIFVDGANVLFTTPRPSEISSAVLRIARDPALGLRLTEGGRRLYQKHLTWPTVVSRLMGP